MLFKLDILLEKVVSYVVLCSGEAKLLLKFNFINTSCPLLSLYSTFKKRRTASMSGHDECAQTYPGSVLTRHVHAKMPHKMLMART